MILTIGKTGTLQFLHNDELYGAVNMAGADVRRASHVEPGNGGTWTVDLTPVGGEVHGGFATRSEALEFERVWIEENVL